MPSRKRILAATRALKAGENVSLPVFDPWSQRHANGYAKGEAAAKASLIYAFLSLVAGGQDEIPRMLDDSSAVSKALRDSLSETMCMRGGLHRLIKFMDLEASTISAHKGPNGEPASDRVSQAFKSRLRSLLTTVVPKFADAQRLAPHIANSSASWQRALKTPLGGGPGSFGKLPGPVLADKPHQYVISC